MADQPTAILLIPGKHDAVPQWAYRLAQRRAGDKPVRAEMMSDDTVRAMTHSADDEPTHGKDGVVIRDPGWSGISFWC